MGGDLIRFYFIYYIGMNFRWIKELYVGVGFMV